MSEVTKYAYLGYAVSCVMACALRICTTILSQNIKILVAYTVFLNIGVVLMFMLNLALARRLMRAKFPTLGVHPGCSLLFWGLCTLCALAIIMALAVIIQACFALDNRIKNIDRVVQLSALTTFAIISFIPLPIVTAALFQPDVILRFFAYDRPIARVRLLLIATFTVCLSSSYRCGVTWLDPVPLIHPKPKYMHTACFYAFYFMSDFIVIAMHAVTRVDRIYMKLHELALYQNHDSGSVYLEEFPHVEE